MTLTKIKEEAESLADKEQKELISYLLHIRQNKVPDYIHKITQAIDDKSEERWIKYKDVRSELLK